MNSREAIGLPLTHFPLPGKRRNAALDHTAQVDQLVGKLGASLGHNPELEAAFQSEGRSEGGLPDRRSRRPETVRSSHELAGAGALSGLREGLP